MRRWKKIFHANGNQKKAGVAILIADKIDVKIKNVTRDKEGYYIMTKGSIQEDITIINIYAPNIVAPQYIRQLLTAIKEEIDSNTVIVGDFNTSLTPMDRSSRQKINNKETQALNDTIHQVEKEKQTKPKVSRRKEIIKIRSEINEIERKETIAKINKSKSWFLEKINKIDKPLARVIKKKWERTPVK